MVLQQVLARHAVREAEPDEERALAARVEPAERGDHPVAPPLVERAPLLDRLLRPGQRRDARLLHGHEHAGEDVVLEILDPRDELRVPDREAEPPARHPVRLRHGEQLEPDLARAVLREEAGRPAAVEDEVAVGEVVQQPRARVLRPLDRFGEDARRRGGRGRVGRVVEIERGRLRRRRVPVRPAVREQRQRHVRGRGERDGRAVVRVAGIREHERAAALDRHLRELHQPRLRPRQHRHLARRIDLDAVHVAVARRDRLLQRRQPGERRVAVRVRTRRRARERLGHVRRRRHVRIAASEVDERLAAARQPPRTRARAVA